MKLIVGIIRKYAAQDVKTGLFVLNDDWQDNVGKTMATLKVMEACVEKGILMYGVDEPAYRGVRRQVGVIMSRENNKITKSKANAIVVNAAIALAKEWHKKYSKHFQSKSKQDIPPLWKKILETAPENDAPSSNGDVDIDLTKSTSAKKLKEKSRLKVSFMNFIVLLSYRRPRLTHVLTILQDASPANRIKPNPYAIARAKASTSGGEGDGEMEKGNGGGEEEEEEEAGEEGRGKRKRIKTRRD